MYEWCEEILSRVHRDLFNWLCQFVPAPSAATLVAGPFMLLLRSGMNGQPSARGVYKDLYQDAESALRKFLFMHGKPMPLYVWRQVPLVTDEYLCDLARVYAILWQVTEIGEITIEEQDFLIEVFMLGGYDAEGGWRMHSPQDHMLRVQMIFDRGLRLLDAHRCTAGPDCAKYTELWRDEERRHELWRRGYAKSAHRKKFEYGQQIHGAGDDRPPVPNDQVEFLGGGGDRKYVADLW